MVAVVSGCAGVGGSRANAPFVAPRMPTVLPAEATAAHAVVADGEFLARAAVFARQDDIVGAVRVLESIVDQPQRARVATAFVADLTGGNLKAALAVAEGMLPGPAQTAAMATVARPMARRDARAALRWASSLPPSEARRAAVEAVAAELMALEPRVNLELALALPDGPARDEMLSVAVAAWVQRDASAAIVWLRDRPADTLTPRLTASMGFALAQLAPDRAVALAEMLPAGRDRWLLLSAIGQTWVARDQGAAIAWARNLPAGEARDAALAGIETGLGGPTSHHGTFVAGAAAGFGAGGGFKSNAALSGRSAGRAGPLDDDEVTAMVMKLTAENPAGAAQWVAGLPPGSRRDRAMATYVEQVMRNPPPVAADQIRFLPRSELRDQMIEELARQWLLTNPAAAEAWLLDTDLSPDRKAWLLRAAGR